jgi:predicted ATPase
MRYIVAGRSDRLRPILFPTVVLHRDNWDDYGFKSLYEAQLWLKEGERISLGGVKISQRGVSEGRADFRDAGFELPVGCFSIGQEFSYYEILKDHLNASVLSDFLTSMRDVVYDESLLAAVLKEPAFTTSLVREGAALRVLEDAPRLFSSKLQPGAPERIALNLEFETQVGGLPFTIGLDFGDDPHLPSRINAIIGYNGTGKTTLLANLALVANADRRQRATLEMQDIGTLITGGMSDFSKVIAVSYSAFDTFRLPERVKGREYVYCGLRRYSGGETQGILKSSQDLVYDFLQALDQTKEKLRQERLRLVFDILDSEASFGIANLASMATAEEETARAHFERLSTGHKIILIIVTQLVANLQPGAIVLIDEPETHLHPPLISALLRGLTAVLERFDSFAVVATHSPVVLQEVPRRYVRILRRYGEKTVVAEPEVETFGENVGVLTRNVFSLDSSKADWQEVLRALVGEFGEEGVARLFPQGLSTQAEILVNSLGRDTGAR